MKATYQKHILQFKTPSGTSRGVLHQKETWFIFLHHNGKTGIGECGLLRGLSVDDVPNYEQQLQWVCENINLGKAALWEACLAFPSIQFGIEQAFLSLEAIQKTLLFPSEWTSGKKGITINGLVWMGTKEAMKKQIIEKLSEEFSCVKLKIGAIHFEEELSLLHYIRTEFDAKTIEIRVDANGAFSTTEALEKLKRLSDYELHSIEQPIATKQWQQMAALCEQSPIPIALDEELIGVFDVKDKQKMIETIQPHYLIFKPSFIGGIKGTSEWIDLANKANIGWWNTSALESNIGLNAITQWTYTLNNPMPQGLGTGSLYSNNFPSPLTIRSGQIWNDGAAWDVSVLV